MVRYMPLNRPNDLNDSIKYWEHDGVYLQLIGKIGDKNNWYDLAKPMIMIVIGLIMISILAIEYHLYLFFQLVFYW